MQMLGTSHNKVWKLRKLFTSICKNICSLSPTQCYLSVCREYSEYVYVNDESGPAMSVLPMRKMEKVPKCGIVETTLIVGGTRVTNELEFPHMVSIIILRICSPVKNIHTYTPTD